MYEVEFVGITLGTGQRNGHSEATSSRDGNRGDLLDGLIFESSLDGILAAFFLRVALPGYLAWDHGLYGRDQQLIFSSEQAVALLEWAGIASDGAGLQALTVPAGLRVCRDAARTLTMSCLTYDPGNGLCDYAVSVGNGRASSVRKTMLFRCGGPLFY